MKHYLTYLISVCILVVVTSLNAGTIRGKVSAEVKAERDTGKKSGSYSSRKYKFLEQNDYSKFSNFVISIADITVEKEMGEPPVAVVEQKNGEFIPQVLPVSSGTHVEWPNRDDIFHNVFSISETKPFDLGYYKKEDDAKVVVFEKPGRVDVFCSIHSKMNCIVLVMPNPWFSSTDKRGRYQIDDIPAGTYRIKAWHQRLPAKYIDVVVPEDGVVELDIVMGTSDLPKY